MTVKSGKKIVLILISVVVILGAILYLSGIFNEDKDSSKENNTSNITNTEEIEFYSYDDETFVIETKYCDLQYPIIWKEHTEVSIKDEEPYVVEFYVKTESEKVHLFDLSFGEDDTYHLGKLKGDSEIDVYLENYVIDKDKMSEEDYNRCCSMEEDINVLISKLIENYNLQILK